MSKMNTVDSIANAVERGALSQLDTYTALKVVDFTPSVVAGRRFIGLIHEDGKNFVVQIEVEEVKEPAEYAVDQDGSVVITEAATTGNDRPVPLGLRINPA